MSRTQKYRELLLKQRKALFESFEKLFLSVEMILDNVDQEYKSRKIDKNNKNKDKVNEF